MEELCQRFPSVAQKIMNDVENKALINFKESSKITYKKKNTNESANFTALKIIIYIFIPESCKTNISNQLFDYIITFENSQH